jgi:co-chaperonin GroES (HSP10)
LTRIYPAMSYVVEETAYRFTSTDRATLNSRASQSSVDDIPTNAELATALSSKASTSDVTTVGTAVAAVSTKLGSPAGVSVSADIASIKTDTGTTIPGLFTTLTTKIRKFFQLALRKDAAIATDNATELTELNASGGSGAGAYSNITDAQEAIRDRGDAAWTTGGGGGGGGGESLMLSTTIATVTSQTVLILTDGTGENDAYKDMMVIVTDQATANQKSRAMVASYVGSSKTLTLSAACTFTVAVGDTVYIVAVSGRTTEFTGTALAKLNAVQAAVVMQTGATGYSVVRPGGKIVLKAGDDYADDIITTISLPVTDADEVVYDRLTAGDTATIKFAAGRNRQKNLIVGTITKADVTKAAGVTYVPIEIARAQLVASTDPSTNRVFNDYKYDIQVTTSGGKVTTPVGGELEVEFDNAE